MLTINKITSFLKSKKYSEWIIVSLVFFIASSLYMGASLTNCSNVVLGKSGDHTAGIIYANYTHPNRPWPGISQLTNFPYGENLRIPVSATTQIPSVIHWTLSKAVGSVCGWNLLVLLGYMCNALIMYAFIRWLTKDGLAALFAGYALSFTPYHAFSATGQIAGMFSFLFILALWRFFILWKRPGLLNSVVVGLIFGISFYTDGYFILISLVMIAAIWLAIASYSLLFFRKNYIKIKPQVTYFIISNIVAFISLLPLLWINMKYAKQVNDFIGNARSNILLEAQTYSARLSYYISPKSVLYLGITVVLLVIFYLFQFKKSIKAAASNEIRSSQSTVFIGWTLLILLLISLWFSLQPVIHVGNFELWNPSKFIIVITNVWRVFGRLYIVVCISAVTLASIGLKHLLDRYSVRRHIIFIVAFIMLIIDLGLPSLHFRSKTFNYNSVPQIYTWLRDDKESKNIKAIAEYPLEGFGYQADYFTYLQISNKPIMNANVYNGNQVKLKLSLIGINDPQTVPVLRSLGIDLVNIRDIIYDDAKQNINIRNSVLSNKQLSRIVLNQKNDDFIDSYRIVPGQAKSYAVTIEPSEALTTRLNPDGTATYTSNGVIKLGLEKLPLGASKYGTTITFGIKEKNARSATIIQNGKLLWSGAITPEKQIVKLNVSIKAPIEIYSETTSKPTFIEISGLNTAD